MDHSGARLWEDRFPRSDEGIAAFVARCGTSSAVAVEASTPTRHFADAIVAHVGELRIVDSVKTRLKAGYGRKPIGWMRVGSRMHYGATAWSAFTIRRSRFASCASCIAAGTRWSRCGRGSLQRLRAVLLRRGIVEARRLVRHDAMLESLVFPPRAAASVASVRRELEAVDRVEISFVSSCLRGPT